MFVHYKLASHGSIQNSKVSPSHMSSEFGALSACERLTFDHWVCWILQPTLSTWRIAVTGESKLTFAWQLNLPTMFSSFITWLFLSDLFFLLFCTHNMWSETVLFHMRYLSLVWFLLLFFVLVRCCSYINSRTDVAVTIRSINSTTKRRKRWLASTPRPFTWLKRICLAHLNPWTSGWFLVFVVRTSGQHDMWMEKLESCFTTLSN